MPDSRLAGVANDNETTTTYTWDNARRLQDILHKDGTDTLAHHGFTLDGLGNRTHFDEQLPVLSGGAGEFGGGGVAQRSSEPTWAAAADDVDQLVAATTDAAEPAAQSARPGPGVPVAPARGAQPNKAQPLQDTAARPDRQALFHAEPTGQTLDVFDKTTPTASVQVQHTGSKASIRLELPGPAQQRVALGNKATAQVGDLNVSWTSFDDHLKEDLVLSKAPASNSVTFNVQMKGLGFAKDGKGGWVLVDVGGHPHFHLIAPTVKDAAGKTDWPPLT